MILSTLVTSQLHFEMCAGLYGHPVFLTTKLAPELVNWIQQLHIISLPPSKIISFNLQ